MLAEKLLNTDSSDPFRISYKTQDREIARSIRNKFYEEIKINMLLARGFCFKKLHEYE